MGIFSLFVSLLVLAIQIAIVYWLLWRTDVLVRKLALTRHLSEEPISLTMHRSQIYTLAIIVSGLSILVFSIPALVRDLYPWYTDFNSTGYQFRNESYHFEGVLVRATEVVIGLLFLGNQRLLVNYIELRMRQSDRG